MSDKRPQSAPVLIHRLRRVAKWLDQMATNDTLTVQHRAQHTARANTCWQAAGRLEELWLRDTRVVGPCGESGHPLTCNCYPEEL